MMRGPSIPGRRQAGLATFGLPSGVVTGKGVVLYKELWQQTDRYLVECCLKGDEMAWYGLVQRYKKLIYHFPASATLSAPDREEVFQETLLALYQNLEKIQQVEDLSYWISRVARRLTWRQMNQDKAYAELPGEFEIEDQRPHADDHLVLALQQFKIRQAMARLDEKCRELLTMLFYETDESSYKRITGKLGLAMGSVGPTRNRCLAKLKKILKKLGVDEKNVSKWLS